MRMRWRNFKIGRMIFSEIMGQIMTIHIETINTNTYKVRIESRSTTEHTVTVSPEYVQKLTQGYSDAIKLIEKSFEFLLEREPNTSILRSFELSVIDRYFPEYEREISKRLG